MIDLHCHILPGLDDGAADDAEMLRMAEDLLREGVDTVVATPHYNGVYTPDAQVIDYQIEHCAELLAHHGLPLRVLPGCEMAMGADTLMLWQEGRLPGLGGGRTLLLELPPLFLVEGARRLIEQCATLGTGVIIAHPERNPTLMRDLKTVEMLRYAGAHLQITATSLDGWFGPGVQDGAETLLRRHMVEYVASDLHPQRKVGLKKAAKRIEKICGKKMANDILLENPRLLLATETRRLAC
jgi:protein-tyrosine phosphatase